MGLLVVGMTAQVMKFLRKLSQRCDERLTPLQQPTTWRGFPGACAVWFLDHCSFKAAHLRADLWKTIEDFSLPLRAIG